MENSEPQKIFENLASAPYVINIETGEELSNFQLYNWKEAKRKWREMISQNRKPRLEEMASIVSNSGESLSQLLGQNANTTLGEQVPSPRNAISKVLPELKQDDPELYRNFLELNELYEAVRHFGRPKEEKVRQLTREMTAKILNVTQQIWFLVLEKKIKGNISEDIRREFSEKFE